MTGVDYGQEVRTDRKKSEPVVTKGFYFFPGEDVPSAENLRNFLPYALRLFENGEFSRDECAAQVLRDQLAPSKNGKTSVNRLKSIVTWLEHGSSLDSRKTAVTWLNQMLGWTQTGFNAMYKDNFY